MVTEPGAWWRTTFVVVTVNDAGQGGGWTERGRAATVALRETWEGLADACDELSDSEWARPTECPGWDVKDQLSHLVGIERSIMGQPAPIWDGPFGDHVHNDFARSNEPWIAVRRPLPGPTVLAEFVEVAETRLAQLDLLTEDQWAAVGWSPLGERPHAEFMEIRVYDSWVHEQDVRRALDRPGGSANLASALSIDRVQGAMGFVVGKRAGCPDGTVVRFDVAGPHRDARVFTVAVQEGRARPVDDEVAPTVTLSMSSLDFVRLGCGRVGAAELEAAGTIGVGGDAAAARSVLDAMNFMP
jgi:uncharacterized protein (TIGR03083 family)